jgi:hypothetical protein
MNKLFEQEWSLDDIPADGTVISTKKADTKKADTKKADTKKADTKKADTKKADTKKVDAWETAEINDYRRQLISNAVVFYEAINRQVNQSLNIDEDVVWNVITKRMIGAGGRDAQLKTAYCDIIIRIANSKSLQSYIKKNPKQYEYFIQRNGSIGTTIDYLKSIENPYMSRLDDLFVGTLGDWMDFDSEATIGGLSTPLRIRSLNRHVFAGYKYNSNDNATVKLKLRYSDSEINSKVLSFYKNNVFGVPKEQFK